MCFCVCGWQDMGIEDPGLLDLIKQVEAEEEKLQKSRLFQVGGLSPCGCCLAAMACRATAVWV